MGCSIIGEDSKARLADRGPSTENVCLRQAALARDRERDEVLDAVGRDPGDWQRRVWSAELSGEREKMPDWQCERGG